MQLSTFFESLLDTLAPPRRSEKVLRILSFTELSELALCTPTASERNEHSAVLPYREPIVAALIWELKYHGNKRAQKLAGELLAETLLSIASEEVGRIVLIPIPMHAKRRKERGHNQTELLCEAALEESRRISSEVFEYRPDILVRVRHTAPQQGLPQHRRLKNVKNTMELNTINSAAVEDRVCVVIDDVATTGATFTEARRALRAAHPRRVYCVALAGA